MINAKTGACETFGSATAIAVLLQKLTDMEPIRIPDPIYQPVKCGAVRSYKEPEKPA